MGIANLERISTFQFKTGFLREKGKELRNFSKITSQGDSIHQFNVVKLNGLNVSLKMYQGKVLLIVNMDRKLPLVK